MVTRHWIQAPKSLTRGRRQRSPRKPTVVQTPTVCFSLLSSLLVVLVVQYRPCGADQMHSQFLDIFSGDSIAKVGSTVSPLRRRLPCMARTRINKRQGKQFRYKTEKAAITVTTTRCAV